MNVERLTPADWLRYQEIRLRALSGDPDAFGSRHEDEVLRAPQSWRERLERADATLVVRRDGVDVGLCVVSDAEGEDAGLYSVWVAPEARGQGVGRALVEEAVRAAREAGYTRMVLEVSEHGLAARALYARLGFMETGRMGTLPAPRDHIQEYEMALSWG